MQGQNNNFFDFCKKIKDFLRFDYLDKIENSKDKNSNIFKISGTTKTSNSFIASLLYSKFQNQKSLLYIIDDRISASYIKMEILSFLKIMNVDIKEFEVMELPSKSSGERLLFFEKLMQNLTKKKTNIVIANSNALLEQAVSKIKLENDRFELKVGAKVDRENLIKKLTDFGFSRQEEVYEKQDFSIRGEIFDIWLVDFDNPIRVIFDDDEIESIYEFDVTTQRRENKKYESCFVRNFTESNDTIIFDYFDTENFICFYEEKNIGNTKHYLFEKKFFSIVIEPFALGAKDLKFYESMSFNGNLDLIYKYLGDLFDENFSICIVLYRETEIQNIKNIFYKNFPKAKLKIDFFTGFLREGFYSLDKKIAIFTEKEIFGRDLVEEIGLINKESKENKNISKNLDVFKESSVDYRIGDYVVHDNFGIGKFLGFSQINTGGKVSEYITIEYAKGDKLFVPIFDFKFISKYSNYDSDYIPLLDTMDGFTWKKTRQKIEQKIFEMATEIIAVQAVRKKIKGFDFKENILAESEFGDTFPYQETEDQEKAIEEVLADMSSDTPMERLVCGDVGYGKTEVAIRATFRAIMNTKQVVLVCPTTILAKQHFNTFKNRFLNYPVQVVMLSRFISRKEIENNKKLIEEGKVDIIIATHAIFRSSIKFKDLGLVIIDEEHRFGVKDKEKLKRLQKDVDVLYLSATPIPRTLSMALNGIKDISVIETPPPVRKNITTHICEYDEDLIKKAIDFELARNGQVFFVYNRVENIVSKATDIAKLFPDTKIAIAHGRMSTDELDTIMTDFVEKKYNILIATTIIESGLDIPAVNMIIIDRADKLGLAQIYQLRGRVGRGYEQAFCYLLYPKNASLNENAVKRLQAIQSFQGFGAGFKLAMRDLEIRGAGNILGKKQHGYIKEIGFELYMDMLGKAINSMNGNSLNEIDPDIDLNVSFYIPNTYISSAPIRMYFYKQLLSINNKNEIDAIKLELFDRFGKIPLVLENFFVISEIKFIAKKLKISYIKENKNNININFANSDIVNIDNLLKIVAENKEKIKFKSNNTNIIEIINMSEDKLKKLEFLKYFLENIL
jgi:transcription-repair coupling factor (superfamily II helicase)